MKLTLQIAAGLVLAALIISFLPSIGYAVGAIAAVLLALSPFIVLGLVIWGLFWAVDRYRRPRPAGNSADHG